ncbi:cellular morphogenesis protein [Zalerion maritima]|uniref:Cellular morphogenesis protein n=1 Tax=Zalerion maritima TaxID=339359 RepID=A0AAD5RPT2_9PEZI|nr:cellular morphogenesis protein [Zalerion maritima]
MRLPFRGRPASRRWSSSRAASSSTSSLLALSTLVSTASAAIEFTEASTAKLDLENLGQVGIAGDFSGISLVQYEGQTETPFSTNGSESLLAQLPNGQFVPIVSTDASIRAMCQFVRSSGEIEGVVIGGNFTSLDGEESQGIAIFNPNTTEITPLEGLSGQVNALLCDQDTDTVYIGGNFKTGGSTNAIAYDGETGWKDLGFAGFNGPVSTITKTSGGKLVFGGSFTGLGNTSFATSDDDLQVINLGAANISSELASTTDGFSDPSNIICKDDFSTEGSGSTWLMQDQSLGSWEANFGFGFQPTKLRLYNTHLDGRGTKTWRFTVIPDNGIMNFTYIDPADGVNKSCTSECPLSDNSTVTFQDFFFVNRVGMDGFRIDISEFYGAGAGFNGIQLFQEDVFAYAINDFNAATCAGVDNGSSATTTGPWETSPSLNASSQYLTADLTGTINADSAAVTFSPRIRESGHYSVNMYTPGCLQDNTCSTRGQVNITVNSESGVDPKVLSLYQTNNYHKYDQVFFGFLEAGTFQPTVVMTPLAGQGLSEMTIVAQRVGFTHINSTGGLNGMFEFDPNDTEIDDDDFTDSQFDTLSTGFSSGSAVNTLVTSGDVTYIGGNFSSDSVQNIIAVNDDTVQNLDGGLNGEVNSLYLNNTSLYVGGDFSNTRDEAVDGLSNVAVYSTSDNSFSALGAGLDGPVLKVVPVKMSVGDENQEVVITFTGDFAAINAFDDNPEVAVDGFAAWVPSKSNWLTNLSGNVPGLSGILCASLIDLPDGDSLLAGSVASSQIGANGAAALYGDGDVLGGFPVQLNPTKTDSNSTVTKREVAIASNVTGVATGAFYTNNDNNVTILAGHFDATATNGTTVRNLIFIDAENDNELTGIGSTISEDSTFVALGISDDTLFAGGDVSGTADDAEVGGIISYNLADRTLNNIPALSGANGTVSSIAVRPNNPEVYVGGSFDNAGELGCPGVCFYSTDLQQWDRPGVNLQGSAHCLMWSSDTVLVAGGSLIVNNTSTFLARYDTDRMSWDTFAGASSIPGPVEVVVPASSDGSQAWVAGRNNSTGEAYLMKYDGSNWNDVSDILVDGTEVRSLQMFTVTDSHDDTDLVDKNRVLMLMGHIVIPDTGDTASVAFYDGSSLHAYALTTSSRNTAGTISRIFTEKANFFESSGGNMPLVFVVLIGLAISLALVALIVIAGVIMDRIRKKREGYVPAPTSMYDRGSGLQRIPPAELLENLGRERDGPPQIR